MRASLEPYMDEFSCINRYIRPILDSGFSTENDDTALVSSPSASFIVSKDILVEGVHFLKGSKPELLAKKALRVSLSDIAAMGGTPHSYLLGLSLPRNTSERWWQKFSSGLREDNLTFSIKLIGGDTTANNVDTIFIDVTVLGIPESKPLTRSGAKIGDLVYVSGTIGDATLGLKAYRGLLSGEFVYLKTRYDLPIPRIALGRHISEIASACIDISDGVMQDIGHISNLSGVGARIEAQKIPFSDAAQKVIARNPELIEEILTGGDDYELAFTAPADKYLEIEHIAYKTGVRITQIGHIVAEPGVLLHDRNGNPISLSSSGYRHNFF